MVGMASGSWNTRKRASEPHLAAEVSGRLAVASQTI